MVEVNDVVSVGIPTYNRPEGLRRTLACITTQTYHNLEIIVSDNASPDVGVEAVVRDFMANDARIVYYKHSVNSGASSNFKFVLRKAAGTYFMWAADDDEWEMDFISRCMAEIHDVGSVMCEFDTVFRDKGIVERNPLPCLGANTSKFQDVLEFFKVMQPTLIYGLHRRADLAFFLTETEWFDFYDCYFVIRLILGSGIKTIQGVSYRTGIDAPEYVIKTANEATGQLTYLPFARRVVQLLFGSKNLTLREKTVSIVKFIKMILGLRAHHKRILLLNK